MAFFVRDLYGQQVETTFEQWASASASGNERRNAARECAGLPPKTLSEEVNELLDQLRRNVHRQIDRDSHSAKRAIKYRANKALRILFSDLIVKGHP